MMTTNCENSHRQADQNDKQKKEKKRIEKAAIRAASLAKTNRNAVDRTIINMTIYISVYKFIPMWFLKIGLYGKPGSFPHKCTCVCSVSVCNC